MAVEQFNVSAVHQDKSLLVNSLRTLDQVQLEAFDIECIAGWPCRLEGGCTRVVEM